MANNNPPRKARSASKDSAGRSTANSRANSSGARTGFYALLIAIAVIGAGVILYLMKNPATGDANAERGAQYDSLKANYAKAGPAQPYIIGNANAPVVIEEFADFECPVCGSYATVTEPDVRRNIIQPGLASYKFYDFPLPMHKNSQAASSAAACADEQGKFWQMHDQLFAGQDAWGLQSDGATQVTDNPTPIFLGYATAIGLNTDQWEKCFDARKFQPRINANAAEGFRRNVNQTPTFYVNGKAFPGSISYDALKKAVDEAAAAPKPASAQ